MDVSLKLHDLMCKSAISAYRLGKDIGVNTSTVTGWLKGTTPSPSNISKLSHYFKVNTDYFFSDNV